jgi:putative oxidoreductase
MNITHPLPRRIGTWTLHVVVAAAFFAAGAMKLAAVPSEVQLFAQIGLGQWFRVVTGVVQIVGAFALVYPGLASIGGLWLGFTMFCAVVANVAVLHTSPAPAIVLMLLNALIVYLRRGELASLARTLLGGANSPTPKNVPTHTRRE